MAETPAQLKVLLEKYVNDSLSGEERTALFQSLATAGNAELWKDLLREMSESQSPSAGYQKQEWEAVIQKILVRQAGPDSRQSAGHTEVRKITAGSRRWWYAAAAAALLIMIGIAVVMNLAPNRPERSIATGGRQVLPDDIAPGRNQAVLTLSGGQQIVLDSAANGLLTLQGNTKIMKLADGQLVYTDAGHAVSEMMYNTMSTPKGGQYRLTLPDGTAVWLNAASSITYPAAFDGNDRIVTITGEAYFEVAKDAARPFHVKAGETEVEVLGTHFNVNAYADEPGIAATLLEGSVRVVAGKTSGLLKPGQQARVQQQRIQVMNGVNLEQVVAWKNGYFQFDRTDIQTVMRQLSRWYDVEVVYEGPVPKDRFGGKLPRDAQASQVLRALEQTQVHFRIEEKKIIVMP